MGNSPLVTYTKLSPNCTKPRNHKIDTISIHVMDGNLTVKQCLNLSRFVNYDPVNGASCNYAVDSTGAIGMGVEEANRSWCTSSGSNDHRAITIEVANDGGKETGYHVSDKAIDSLVKLLADICKRNGIPKLLWKADKSLIGKVDQQNMTVHRWFANKACPGDYLYNKHGEIAERVNKLLEKPALTPNQQTIQNAVDDGVITMPDYWLNVLDGKKTPSAANVKALIDKYHDKVKK